MSTLPSEPMAPMDAAADVVRDQHKDTPESPFTTEFAMEVLAEVRQSALEAFRSLPYGGLEVGGVLFGRVSPSGRNPKRVEVIATRPMECDHAAGPAFILSSAERVKLAQMFEHARQEEELAALSVVGFWISHGRSELGLTTTDADLYRAFFPHSWQIALMMKPENRAPMREALFCRVNGRILPYRRPSEIAVAPSVPVVAAAPVVMAMPPIFTFPAPNVEVAPAAEVAVEVVPVEVKPVEVAEPVVEAPVLVESEPAPLLALEPIIPVVEVSAPVVPVVKEPVTAAAIEEEVAPAPIPVLAAEPQYLVPEYREQPQYAGEVFGGRPNPIFREPDFFQEPFRETAVQEFPLPEPVISAVAPQEPTYLKPLVTETPRFATDIYLPSPPVEPPSVKPWPKDLYRPAGRTRALVQTSPAVEPPAAIVLEMPAATAPPVSIETQPEIPEEELTAPVPRLRSYWEKETKPEAAVVVEALEAEVVAEPLPVATFEQNWPRQILSAEPAPDYSQGWTAPDYSPEPEVVEEPSGSADALMEPIATLKAVDYDPNIPPSFDLPAMTPPPLPVAQALPASEPEAVPTPNFTSEKATAQDVYVAPKVETPKVETPKVELPKVEAKPQPAAPVQQTAEIGDELARLLVSIRAATAESKGSRVVVDEEGEELPRTSRFAKHNFGLVTLVLLMLVGLALGGVLGFWFFGNHQQVAAKAPGPDLGLEMFNTGKEVLIHWEAKSPLVLHARTAELRIHDSGMVQTLLLDLSGLSKGYYRYQPTSSDVQTTLIVTENDGHTEQSIASRYSE